MLIKDFYYVENHTAESDGSHVYTVKLNANHSVYQGHFPERHITPGVCNIQMIKECIEDATSKRLTFTAIDRCRLTAMVTPEGSPILNIKVQTDPADTSKVSATIFYGDTTYMTLSGIVAEKQ
ncbi:MAG: beta-hydroxyacyl-ACP dehydratase [Bacteroidales bacterium]|nr:beta-hydroxyacyl-ACP dehydratase [Bacteroidales bacterium]